MTLIVPMLNEPVATYKGFVVYAAGPHEGRYFSRSNWGAIATPLRNTVTEVQRDIWIYWNPRGSKNE